MIALKFRNKERGVFWRKVNALNTKTAPLANNGNGCTGSSDIAEKLWVYLNQSTTPNTQKVCDG